MKKKIVITGGGGRFGSILKNIKTKYKIYYPSKNKLDITKPERVKLYLKKIKPNYVIHLAGLSRPMSLHERNISKSISLNIIGTSFLNSRVGGRLEA